MPFALSKITPPRPRALLLLARPAMVLDLSPHTVKRHVASILDKLDLASRAQASAWWRLHLEPAAGPGAPNVSAGPAAAPHRPR